MTRKNLSLTPTTARELALLAELVGWAAFVPILLDIASRPNYCAATFCSWNWRLGRVWGGFKALNILSSEHKRPNNAVQHVTANCDSTQAMLTALDFPMQRRHVDQAASH